MKKTMRKVLKALVCITLLVCMMSMTVNAAGGLTDEEMEKTQGSITISKDGSEFEAYRLLDFTVPGGQNVYDYTASEEFKEFFNNTEYGSYTIEKIAAYDSYTLDTETLAQNVQKYASDKQITGKTIVSDTKTTVPLGYYLIRETKTSTESATVASKPMLVSVPSIEISGTESKYNFDIKVTTKDSKADIDKCIVKDGKDVDHSVEAIGSDVSYKLVAGVPTYEQGATGIKYYMTDTLSKGLSFKQGSVQVYGVNGTTETLLTAGTDYTIKTNPVNLVEGTETTITIDFTYDNIKGFQNIKVLYNATLNQYANVGETGNPNNVKLSYTNNPSVKDEYTTPKKEVITYTYGFGIIKTDPDAEKNPELAGAQFEIKKGDTFIKTVIWNGTEFVGSSETGTDGWLYAIGLEEGSYTIKEIKAPEGYVLPSGEIAFEIIAQTGDNGEPNGKVVYKVNNNVITETTQIATEVKDIVRVVANVPVTNTKGFNLPVTGGAGTWMFTVGGVVIMAAAVLLIFKTRRKEA